MAERPSLPAHQPRPAGAATALAGVRVIDFSHFIAGPYCTMTLGDLGAEVIKIENPVIGDNQRLHAPSLGGQSASYLWANRNKLGVTLDINSPAGREVALALVDQADVLVENFSSGVMDRLGFSYAELSARNPRLIYCSISAAGRSGPMAQRMGFDPIAQAESGMMALTGHPGSDPVIAGAPIMDITTGMMASNAILAALHARDRLGGQGQYIDIAMFDQAAQLVSFRAYNYLVTGVESPRVGNASRVMTPIGVYPTATGPLFLCCANERTYRRLALDVFGRSDLADGEAFGTNAARLARYDEFNDIVRAILKTDTRDAWLAKMRAAGVPVGPVATIAEAYTGEDMRERGLLSEIPHPTAGSVPNVAPPYRLSLTPVVDPVAAPTLGQHTEAVLRAVLHYDDEAIERLARSGALGQASRDATQNGR